MRAWGTAVGWTALALAQALSSQIQSPRIAIVLRILAAARWIVVAFGVGSAVAAAHREEKHGTDANQRYERARLAAELLVRRCAATQCADVAARIARAIEFAPRRVFGTERGAEVLRLLGGLPGVVAVAELNPLARAVEMLSRPRTSGATAAGALA
jgi:hypothetical protein